MLMASGKWEPTDVLIEFSLLICRVCVYVCVWRRGFFFFFFIPGCKCWWRAAADHRAAPDEPLYIHCPRPPASSSARTGIQFSKYYSKHLKTACR